MDLNEVAGQLKQDIHQRHSLGILVAGHYVLIRGLIKHELAGHCFNFALADVTMPSLKGQRAT